MVGGGGVEVFFFRRVAGDCYGGGVEGGLIVGYAMVRGLVGVVGMVGEVACFAVVASAFILG